MEKKRKHPMRDTMRDRVSEEGSDAERSGAADTL